MCGVMGPSGDAYGYNVGCVRDTRLASSSSRPSRLSRPSRPRRVASRRVARSRTSAGGIRRVAMRDVIGAETRCVVRDGRAFVGRLRCVDKQRNIILSNAREYASAAEAEAEGSGKTPSRTINMVLLSREERVSCEIRREEDGEAAAEALAGLKV